MKMIENLLVSFKIILFQSRKACIICNPRVIHIDFLLHNLVWGILCNQNMVCNDEKDFIKFFFILKYFFCFLSNTNRTTKNVRCFVCTFQEFIMFGSYMNWGLDDWELIMVTLVKIKTSTLALIDQQLSWLWGQDKLRS